jgi:transposase InsO family protein
LVREACHAGARKKKACELLEIDLRTHQRWQKEKSHEDKRLGPKTLVAHQLTAHERALILEVANSPEFCNQSPSQIVPRLADQGIFIASESSFYRVLKAANQMQHRQAAKPKTRHKPGELIAFKPNQVWSWDISYLPTTVRGQFFYLYFFIDIFSRKIVGFDVCAEESADHAARVMSLAYHAEGLQAGDVTLHSDNGGPMKGSLMLATLQRLGVIPSFSRPSVSDDNPFSESLFKTTKYCPFYPSHPFASLEEARAWILKFVQWYNTVHQHSAINFVTPHARHLGLAPAILEKRVAVYAIAQQKNPQRWSGKARNWSMVKAVYLNPKHSKEKAA